MLFGGALRSCLFADQELRQLLREDEKRHSPKMPSSRGVVRVVLPLELRKLGKEVFDQYRQWYKLERGRAVQLGRS